MIIKSIILLTFDSHLNPLFYSFIIRNNDNYENLYTSNCYYDNDDMLSKLYHVPSTSTS